MSKWIDNGSLCLLWPFVVAAASITLFYHFEQESRFPLYFYALDSSERRPNFSLTLSFEEVLEKQTLQFFTQCL